MIISKQYAWRSTENYRENNPLLPRNIRGLVIGKSGCGKTTAIFNQTTITCTCLKRVFISKNTRIKGLEVGLSKQQISNLFNRQEALGNISPLTDIEKFSGARNGKI